MPVQSNLIAGFGLLLGFQLGGEMIARALGIPIPGSIVGLLLLFAWLKIRADNSHTSVESAEATEVAHVARPLLRNLAILFVPSGVGVMEFGDVFAAHSLALILVVIASTLLTLAATALAFVAAKSIAARLRHRQRMTVRKLWTIQPIAPSETRNR
jgi:holin-like protein